MEIDGGTLLTYPISPMCLGIPTVSLKAGGDTIDLGIQSSNLDFNRVHPDLQAIHPPFQPVHALNEAISFMEFHILTDGR